MLETSKHQGPYCHKHKHTPTQTHPHKMSSIVAPTPTPTPAPALTPTSEPDGSVTVNGASITNDGNNLKFVHALLKAGALVVFTHGGCLVRCWGKSNAVVVVNINLTDFSVGLMGKNEWESFLNQVAEETTDAVNSQIKSGELKLTPTHTFLL